MTEQYQRIEKYMPGASHLARAYFVESNPELSSITWAEALKILEGAHSELTDAIYEDLKISTPLGMIDWITPVFLTMMYARRGRVPFACEVSYELGRLDCWLEREGV